MSGDIDTEMTAKIELLRQQFLVRMEGDGGFIRSCFEGSGLRTVADSEIKSLRKICHSLCGAAGIFGYPPIADAASRMSAAFAAGENDGVRLAILASALVGEIEKAAAKSSPPLRREA